MNKIVTDSRPPLVKNLLFVEGFSRGGKLLLGNIMNGFSGVEPIQYYGLLEHLPFLEKFGLIDKKTTQEIIRCEIDTHCYEMLIGRNFNYRRHDGSSIFKIPGHKKFLQRSSEKNTDKNLEKFHKDDSYSFFMMHELMPNIKIYFDIFPHLKVISIKRNPVGIVYSWYQRGLLRRFGQDPKIFMIPIKGKGGPVPWYAFEFKDIYYDISEIERVILSIKNLFDMYKNSYAKLSPKFRNRILLVPFEDFFSNHNTGKLINVIGQFLNKKPIPEMPSILKGVEAPRNGTHSKVCQTLKESLMCYDCKLREIEKIAPKKYFDILVKLKKEYETGKTY